MRVRLHRDDKLHALKYNQRVVRPDGFIRKGHKAEESSMHLDLLLQFTFETSPKDFPLTRFETVSYRGNGANIIRHRETDAFFIDKFRVRDFFEIVIKESPRLGSRMSGR